jgi:hypothetical protein
MEADGIAGRAEALRHPDRLAGEALGGSEGAVDHPDLGERGQDARPLDARRGWDEVHRPLEGGERTDPIAGGSPVLAEPLVQDAERDAVAALVESSDERFDVGGGPGRPLRGERRLGRPELERGDDVAAGALAGRGSSGGAGPAERRRRKLREEERQLEGDERVLRGVGRLGPARRVDGGGERPIRHGGLHPVPGRFTRVGDEPGRERDVEAAPDAWQEVRRGGPPDVLVAEGDAVLLLEEDPLFDRLVEPGREVRIEAGVAAPGPAGGARREAVRGRLERAGDVGELVPGDGTTGECQQPQQAPAFGAATGQAGDHEIVEGAGQARVGDLAAGREQLLGDERQAARPVGHEDQGGAGRALPFDRLDEVRELRPFERPDPDAERPRDVPSGRLRQRGVERMVPRQLVGRVGADEADPVVTADPAEERDEGARAGVGIVEVLEDEEHGPPFAQPPDDSEQGFQHAALAPLRGDDRRLRGKDAGVIEPGLDLGKSRTTSSRAGPASRTARRRRDVTERRVKARTIGPYGSSAPTAAGRPAADDREEGLPVGPPTRRGDLARIHG